jgi:hypothetical protein
LECFLSVVMNSSYTLHAGLELSILFKHSTWHSESCFPVIWFVLKHSFTLVNCNIIFFCGKLAKSNV